MDKWYKQKIDSLDLSDYCEDFYYYKREMGYGPAAINNYYANIFICTFSSANQLIEKWEDINYMIAFHVQSHSKELIEKSNFYICLFVAEQIDPIQKNVIQRNSFCAKKYVFENGMLTEEMCIKKVEQKIFSFEVEKTEQDALKIENIELQNFRGYEGNFKIDLTGKNEKSAAFTLIYAKNGYGKTSLFDGIEYALKGEVSRIVDLEEVNKKNPMKGAVYHNKNRGNERAYVALKLEKGKEVLRNVSSIQNGKNDCRRNNVGKNSGLDIVGKIEENKKWDRIILPHDKIDRFIFASSPAEKYREWLGSAPELKTYQDSFVNEHAKLRKQQNEINKHKEELEKQRKELLKLETSKVAVSKFIQLCEEYNKLVKDDEKLVLDILECNVDTYNSLLNEILITIRIIKNNILPQYENKILIGKELQGGDIQDSEKLEKTWNYLHDKKKECIEKIRRNKQYSEAQKRIKRIEVEIVSLQKEKAPIDAIYKFGVAKVEEAKTRYLLLNKEIESIEATIKYFDAEIQKVLHEQSELDRKVNIIETNILSEKSMKEIEEGIRNITICEKKIESKRQEIQNIQIEVEDIDNTISQKKTVVNQIDLFELPSKVEDLKFLDIINKDLVLDKDEQDLLYQYEKRMMDLQKNMKIWKEILEKESDLNNEIHEICQKGIEFLLAHREVNICPLCNTSFSTWEDLFNNVSRVENSKESGYHQKIQEIIDQISQLDEEYVHFNKRCLVKKDSREKELLDEVTIWAKKKEDKNIQQEICKIELVSLEAKVENRKEWLKEKGILLERYSLDIWNLYKNDQHIELQKLIQNREDLEERKNIIKELKEKNQNSIQEKNKEKEIIVKDSQLYTHVLFLIDKGEGYDLEKERNILNGHIFVLENEKKAKNNILKENKSYEYIDLDSIEDIINECDSEINRLTELKKKIVVFQNFSQKGIEESLLLWNKEKTDYEHRLELLLQMQEENGARLYFDKYKDIQKEIQWMEELITKGEEDKKSINRKFNEKKEELEKLLKDYFSQTTMNEIFQKIDPHDIMKNVTYHLDFSENDEPQLFINVCEDDSNTESYRPELYFSTAQLNTVAFSSFFGRALSAKNTKIKTICIDDPIGHFDDMNILGFTDMIRCILENSDCQIIMSTHDEKIYHIMERKLDQNYYNTSFIQLENSDKVVWDKSMGSEIQ